MSSWDKSTVAVSLLDWVPSFFAFENVTSRFLRIMMFKYLRLSSPIACIVSIKMNELTVADRKKRSLKRALFVAVSVEIMCEFLGLYWLIRVQDCVICALCVGSRLHRYSNFLIFWYWLVEKKLRHYPFSMYNSQRTIRQIVVPPTETQTRLLLTKEWLQHGSWYSNSDVNLNFSKKIIKF